MQDKDYLQLAIDQANKSVFEGGFPAGAIIVKDGKVIGEGISIGNILHDPTSHGETQCVRNACKNIQSSDLSGATLYASMETCAMCLNSCMWAGISKIIFALSKDKLSNLYYGGNYTTADINTLFLKPMDIVQMKELEESSMKVVTVWEGLQKLPQVIRDVGFDFSWSEEKVWKLNYPTEAIDINELTWHFAVPFHWDNGGVYNLTSQEIIDNPEKYKDEYDRTMNADLSHPIDIMENKGKWLILDGLHRLMKSRILGKSVVQVRKIPRSEIINIIQ
jgi:tRNA(Arg) A34 adenosine deaminase TadA